MIEPGRERGEKTGPGSLEEGSESGEQGSASPGQGHRRPEDLSSARDRPAAGGGERRVPASVPGAGGKETPGDKEDAADKEDVRDKEEAGDKVDAGDKAGAGNKAGTRDKAGAGEKGGEKKTRKKIGTRTRGVETMFRSAYRAHLDLTALADTKANIMISINGLILSIILASIGPKIDSAAWLIIPTVIMLVGCVGAIIFAVLAARPRVNPSENLTLEEAMRRDANLLFFGNVSQLTEEEFLKGLRQVLTDRDAVYRSMMRDLYGMASVLTKKFALLRTSYTVFMIGIAASVLAFIIVFVIQTSTPG